MEQATKDKIIELYKTNHYYQTEIADMVGYCVGYINKIIREERRKKKC